MTTRGRAATVALAALLGVLAGAALVYGLLSTRIDGREEDSLGLSRGEAAVSPAPAVGQETQDAITAAVDKVGPAVVNINTVFAPPAQDLLQQILRRQLGIPTEPFPREGQGSGIIIDGDKGYVLTNAHVVKGAQKVVVSLSDGRQFEASVVGVDPLTEVGVVQVSGEGLPEAELGSAEALPIGSWVIAIGNPFGYHNTVTVGVLSAKGRQISGDTAIVLDDLLQTDASINPGNSGGALVDLNGRVVGIPTAVVPYAQGIGFAVPIDTARVVAARLIESGAMPWLGIQHRELTPEESRQLGVAEYQGTMILNLVPGGPAAEGGLRVGDLILAIDGQKTKTSNELGRAIREHGPGDKVEVTVIRSRREIALSVTLGAVPPELGRR
ncbi:MAG: trypsin-like peptidase domain-containing protein [Armatimonadetes bacterium]|nr:trypsin-like peptidase domain-containing protein [Armatimonadota bacterium]